MPDNGRLGSGAFCRKLEEETVLVFSSLSVLAGLVRSKTGLLCEGSAAGGDWERWKKLRLMGVGVMVVIVVVVVVLASLPAGPSTTSTSREVGGDAALPVAGEAARGSSSFTEGSEGSEEE